MYKQHLAAVRLALSHMLITIHDLAGFQVVHRAVRTAWCTSGMHNTKETRCSQMQEGTACIAQEMCRSQKQKGIA